MWRGTKKRSGAWREGGLFSGKAKGEDNCCVVIAHEVLLLFVLNENIGNEGGPR